jgi:multidrug transporter EmrE-like cation transporter
MVYYVGLAGAYRHGDMSVAYPLARALPARLVTIVSFFLGLGKPLSAWGMAGIAAVVLGCLILPLTSFRSVKLANYANICCALAFLAACGTGGYTLVDNEALRQLRNTPALNLSGLQITVLFMTLETFTTTLALALYVALSQTERQACRSILQTRKRQAIFTGLIITGTYGLVLAAMAHVTNISYLAAFRELSIPLGAFLGMIFQKEPAYSPKLIGIGVVLIGLLLIGLA